MRFIVTVDADTRSTAIDISSNCQTDALPLVRRAIFYNAEFDAEGPEVALAAAVLTRRTCGELFEMVGVRLPLDVAEAVRTMLPRATNVLPVDGLNCALATGEQSLACMEASQLRLPPPGPALQIDWSGDFVDPAIRRGGDFRYGRYFTNAALLADQVEVSIAIGLLHAGMRCGQLHVPLAPGASPARYADIVAALRLAGIDLRLVASPDERRPALPSEAPPEPEPAPRERKARRPEVRPPAAVADAESAAAGGGAHTIWLYWDNHYSERRPAYLELCLESIHRHAGGARVVVVEPETLPRYLDVHSLPQRYASLSPNHRSDYLRIRLLRDHGGMWIDIDTIAFQSLSEHVLAQLGKAELVYPGTGRFAMQLFASRRAGAFVSETTTALDGLLATDGPLAWMTLMGDVAGPIAGRHPRAQVPMKCWLHGLPDWRKYLEPGEADYDGRLICILYNSAMFEPLHNLSRKQILDKDWLLSNMFRRALSL